FADQLGGEGAAGADVAFGVAVAFDGVEVEEPVALVDHCDDEREVFGGPGVPGVAVTGGLLDDAEAAAHLGVDVLQRAGGGGEVVAGEQPGAVVPVGVVAAALAVDERELGGGGGGQLAEQGEDEAGLAVADQAADGDAGDAGEVEVAVGAPFVAADVGQGG